MGTGKSRGFAGGPSANSPGEPSTAQRVYTELSCCSCSPSGEERLHLLPLRHPSKGWKGRGLVALV